MTLREQTFVLLGLAGDIRKELGSTYKLEFLNGFTKAVREGNTAYATRYIPEFTEFLNWMEPLDYIVESRKAAKGVLSVLRKLQEAHLGYIRPYKAKSLYESQDNVSEVVIVIQSHKGGVWRTVSHEYPADYTKLATVAAELEDTSEKMGTPTRAVLIGGTFGNDNISDADPRLIGQVDAPGEPAVINYASQADLLDFLDGPVGVYHSPSFDKLVTMRENMSNEQTEAAATFVANPFGQEDINNKAKALGLKAGVAFSHPKDQYGLPGLTGNTFPVKDILKANGARWNSYAKAWVFQDNEQLDAALDAVSADNQSVQEEDMDDYDTPPVSQFVIQRHETDGWEDLDTLPRNTPMNDLVKELHDVFATGVADGDDADYRIVLSGEGYPPIGGEEAFDVVTLDRAGNFRGYKSQEDLEGDVAARFEESAADDTNEYGAQVVAQLLGKAASLMRSMEPFRAVSADWLNGESQDMDDMRETLQSSPTLQNLHNAGKMAFNATAMLSKGVTRDAKKLLQLLNDVWAASNFAKRNANDELGKYVMGYILNITESSVAFDPYSQGAQDIRSAVERLAKVASILYIKDVKGVGNLQRYLDSVLDGLSVGELDVMGTVSTFKSIKTGLAKEDGTESVQRAADAVVKVLLSTDLYENNMTEAFDDQANLYDLLDALNKAERKGTLDPDDLDNVPKFGPTPKAARDKSNEIVSWDKKNLLVWGDGEFELQPRYDTGDEYDSLVSDDDDDRVEEARRASLSEIMDDFSYYLSSNKPDFQGDSKSVKKWNSAFSILKSAIRNENSDFALDAAKRFKDDFGSELSELDYYIDAFQAHRDSHEFDECNIREGTDAHDVYQAALNYVKKQLDSIYSAPTNYLPKYISISGEGMIYLPMYLDYIQQDIDEEDYHRAHDLLYKLAAAYPTQLPKLLGHLPDRVIESLFTEDDDEDFDAPGDVEDDGLGAGDDVDLDADLDSDDDTGQEDLDQADDGLVSPDAPVDGGGETVTSVSDLALQLNTDGYTSQAQSIVAALSDDIATLKTAVSDVYYDTDWRNDAQADQALDVLLAVQTVGDAIADVGDPDLQDFLTTARVVDVEPLLPPEYQGSKEVDHIVNQVTALVGDADLGEMTESRRRRKVEDEGDDGGFTDTEKTYLYNKTDFYDTINKVVAYMDRRRKGSPGAKDRVAFPEFKNRGWSASLIITPPSDVPKVKAYVEKTFKAGNFDVVTKERPFSSRESTLMVDAVYKGEVDGSDPYVNNESRRSRKLEKKADYFSLAEMCRGTIGLLQSRTSGINLSGNQVKVLDDVVRDLKATIRACNNKDAAKARSLMVRAANRIQEGNFEFKDADTIERNIGDAINWVGNPYTDEVYEAVSNNLTYGKYELVYEDDRADILKLAGKKWLNTDAFLVRVKGGDLLDHKGQARDEDDFSDDAEDFIFASEDEAIAVIVDYSGDKLDKPAQTRPTRVNSVFNL